MFARCCSIVFTAVVVAGALSVSALAAAPTVADVLDGSPDAEQSPAAAAEKSAHPDKAEKKAPPAALRKTEKFGRDTPRSTVDRFLETVAKNDFETAAEYLDLRRLPKGMDATLGPDYAEKLEVILDRSLWVDFDDLSPDEEGFSDDGLPSYRDFIGTIEADGVSYDILLQRVPGDDGARIWKFSNATVAQIPRLYEIYGYGKAGEWLSERLPDYTLLGLQTWQWLGLLALLLASYLAAYVTTWPLFFVLRRRESELAQTASRLLKNPLNLIITFLLTKHFVYLLSPSVEARAIMEANTLITLVLIWGAFAIVDLLQLHYAARMEESGRDYIKVLLRPAATTVKIIIAVTALLTWVENLGFKATTLIAGLGVGGLAVALAAQKSIENLIGAITLYLSAPVKVGDFCQFGGQFGVVEEINLRATRIRTLDRTVIAVPNATFSDMELENISVREKIRYEPELCLSHTATAAQVRGILSQLRSALAERADIDQDNLYVRFQRFDERGLRFKSLIYVLTSDYSTYLEVVEEINLRIMDIVAAAGAGFAAPAPLLVD